MCRSFEHVCANACDGKGTGRRGGKRSAFAARKGETVMSDRATYLATMISLSSAAFGVIAALAWNTAISDLIKQFLPAGKGLLPEFLYAVIVTLAGVVVMVNLAKLAEKSGGKSAI